MMEPMINAPRAGEKPTSAARITIIKHKASEIISNISSDNKCFALLSKVGMKKIPPTNHIVKKKTNFKTERKSSPPENC